jgi:hypothetical protein
MAADTTCTGGILGGRLYQRVPHLDRADVVKSGERSAPRMQDSCLSFSQPSPGCGSS